MNLFMQTIFTHLTTEELFLKDIWDAEEMGLTPDFSRNNYSINFSRITPLWLKQSVKKFICFQASTKSFSACKSYLQALSRFSRFLQDIEGNNNPAVVNRALIVKFIQYLSIQELGVVSRQISLTHLKTFHLICLQENCLPWPEKPLIFPSDLPKDKITYPRYIPEIVLRQLHQHLHHLPPYKQRLITILEETGRRISEVCTLPYNCLEQDNQQDWYLRVNEKKLKRVRLIPISKTCLQAIQEQQLYLESKNKDHPNLFPSLRPTRTPYISAPMINESLKTLAHRYRILDDNGQIWNFHCHQFRHTAATSMINNGVPQIVIQRYLGHESPKMTAQYAHIHDETLKKAFIEYQHQLVNTQGEQKLLEGQWLKENIASQILPNGLCALPLTQKRCPHANACLTCANFRTSKQHLQQHKDQLGQTLRLIDEAKQNGWQRSIEMNTDVANNLTKIITVLEKD